MITTLIYITLIVISFVITKNICIPVFRYQFRKKEYKHIWRSPESSMSLNGTDHDTARVRELCDSIYDEESGFYRPVANLGFHFEGYHWIAISDVEIAKEVLYKLDLQKFQPEYDFLARFIGNGLLMSSGEKWKNRRKLITPLFHFDSLKEYVPSITKQLVTLKKDLEALNGEGIDGKDIFADFTMKVIVDLAFGNEFDASDIAEKFTEINKRFNYYGMLSTLIGETITSMIPGKYTKGTSKLLKSIHQDVIEAIKHRNRYPKQSNDLMNILVSGIDENGNPVSPGDIVDECKTFLFAGSDTSSATLSWVMYHLSGHQEIQEKLRNHIFDVLGERDPTYEDLSNLDYLRNVIKETLRLTPVIPMIDRFTTEELNFKGIRIPKNTVIGIFFVNTHRDPRYWSDPLTFNPERWETEKPISFLYTPFSAGSRNCIGEKFAMNEIMLILTMILRHFQIDREPTKITPVFEGVLIPYGLKVIYSPLNVI
eukprot:TRINITY_DN1523_c0_g1_i1.p1 TRINITY_DN1523_c0_g1~~TRINITY_DN1523_c0_g1_i1.p1  ORF type:complete len:484 (+),score=90.68 TRINITY_DN1523_c0_g1_i1:173-1624(+)